ncbi:glycerophosphodiester phosphodiesterase [candidate division KSB1 bacterium]|nr:glycerophosphodiester phosphodiesterase [candidate division KSB1 bacterium]
MLERLLTFDNNMNIQNSSHNSLIIAHRGASYDAPENTLTSFKAGLAQQADGIECDIHLSADNEVIIIHDASLKRTTGHAGNVDDFTLAELKRMDAGIWKDPQFKNEQLPTLQEVFTILPADKKIQVEIKSGIKAIAPVRRIIEQQIISPSQIILMEFDLETVIELRKTFPGIEVLWLVGFSHLHTHEKIHTIMKNAIDTSLEYKFDGVNIQNITELDTEYIRACTSHRLKCYCWTVNEPERARYLIKSGIAGIATDRPGWIRERL